MGTRCGRRSLVPVERRVLREDGALELLERSPRLDAELLDERLARPPVDVERLGLSTAAVEREHELRADALAERVIPHECLELSHQVPVAAEREIRLDSLLERCQPDLFESVDRGAGEGLVREVGKRGSSPQSERLRQEVGRELWLTAGGGPSRFLGQALEPVEVEPFRRDPDCIAGRPSLDQRGGAQRLAKLRDLPLHLRHGRHRRGACIEIVGEPVDRDHPVGAQEQDRQRGPLLRPAQSHLPGVADDFQRAEDAEIEHAPTVAVR